MADKIVFVDSGFKYNITKVVEYVFPKLDPAEIHILSNNLEDIINTIADRFNFDMNNKGLYQNQFMQNNNRDMIGLLLMLLPFIDDETGTKKANITKLDQIYKQTKDGNQPDLNKDSPKYEYSNIQYNRCTQSPIEEISFNPEHIEQNVYFLKKTISTIAHKMYINWIDVRPVSLLDYQDLQMYKDTVISFTDRTLSDNDNDTSIYSGLPISDMYNTMSNSLYEDVKNIKWLMYTYLDDKDPTKHKCYLDVLNSYDNFETYVYKDDNDKDKDTTKYNYWTNLVEDHPEVAKGIIIFFDRNVGKREAAKKDGYKPIALNKKLEELEELEDDEVDVDKEIRDNAAKIEKAIVSISESKAIIHMYTYIGESFAAFKKTWYGKQYLESGFEYIKNIPNYGVTIKNVYNMAKSLTHHTIGDKYSRHARLWRSLSSDIKTTTLDRLNDTDKSWFNIKAYLRKILKVPTADVVNVNNAIYDALKSKLPTIIFEVMIYDGVLSQFVPSAEITKTNPDEDSQQMVKRVQIGVNNLISNDRDKWSKSYYFLTNSPYKDDHLDKLAVSSSWVTTYAMDWISQLSYFHRYLNNRVILVTGSTGVGKSTQIPKLLLYSLKMLDCNKFGKIICTQPRIPPTINNSSRIAEEMGVPIVTKSDNSEPIDNYYVQYKYKGGEHAKDTNDLMLKIVTDGTLYMELQKFPMLKLKSDSTNYVPNKYDIVIVDEAHEHNKNMDLILTMMRYTAYYNNSIKLVIISATMEDDEPVYRRYYRNINDNLIYPHTANTISKFSDLNRVNVDRRLHISPPGQTTRFFIGEQYIEEGQPEYDYKDKKKKEIADQTVVDIIKHIKSGKPFIVKSKDSDGTVLEKKLQLTKDILYFQPGTSDIKASVRYLNTHPAIPADTIAVPFYSKMSDKKKTLVGDIAERKADLKVPKDVEFDEDYDEAQYKDKNYGYKRVIIVATNVAEASITINSLEFVVDTGVQTTVSYDYETDQTKADKTSISESSRLQRKGRVGRVANGMVYYLYKKGSKESVKPQYDIAISDVHDNLFDIIKQSKDNKDTLSLDQTTNMFNIQTPTQTNFSKIRYETGYDYDTVSDFSGDFYIIHPEELFLKRNILGTVAEVVESKLDSLGNARVKLDKDRIVSNKIAAFWRILKVGMLVDPTDTESPVVGKSEYGIILQNMKTTLEIDDIRLAVTYMFSKIYGVDTEVIKIISMLETIENIQYLFTPAPKFPYFRLDLGKEKYKNKNTTGDLWGLLKIADDIINYIIREGFELVDEDTRINKFLKDTSKKRTQWANQEHIHLDNKIVGKFIINYVKHLSKLTKLKDLDKDKDIQKLTDMLKQQYNSSWVQQRLDKEPNEEARTQFKIVASFFHGYGLNTIKSIGTTSCYVQLKNPSPANINKISHLGRIQNTFRDIYGGYLMFIKYDERTGFAILSKIDPDMIKHIYPQGYSATTYDKQLADIEKNYKSLQEIVKPLTESESERCIISTKIGDPYKRALITIARDVYDSDFTFQHQKGGFRRIPISIDPNTVYPLSRYLYKKIHKVNI